MPTTINVPKGLGKTPTFEKGNINWAAGTRQKSFWAKTSDLSVDKNGMYIWKNSRYVIAMRAGTFGYTGNKVDIYFNNGKVLYGILGDEKGSDANNKWGHDGGQSMVEFIVKSDHQAGNSGATWYGSTGKAQTWLSKWWKSNGFNSGIAKVVSGSNTAGGVGDNSQALEDFMTECLSHKGEDFYKFVGPKLGKGTREAWCADFIWACAKQVGIEGKIISGSAGAHALVSQTVDRCGATLHSGSSKYNPQRGDLVNFVWHGGTFADHIGVVTSFKNNTVYTVEGNSSDRVRLKSYSRSSSCLLRFATPNWGAGGGGGGGDQLPENLYDYENVAEDAILREIAYAKKEKTLYVPEKSVQRVKLSIINYTDLQNAFYRAGVEIGAFGVTEEPKYDISELPTNIQEILKHLNEKGVSYSSGCGICAVINHISKFKTSYSSKDNKKFGLLGFSSAMKTWVGGKWSTNVSGQLDYLLYDLGKSHKIILEDLKNMPEVDTGASQAAIYIYQNYLGLENETVLHNITKEAEEYNKKITRVIAVNSGDGDGEGGGDGSNNTFDSSGIKATGKRKAAIERAHAEIGKPYAWGAVGPSSYDCSGLVSYCLTGKHVRLGTTGTFMGWSTSQKREPGDVVVNSHHTGLYIGDGKMIHAPRAGKTVEISGVHSGMKYVVPPQYK